MFCPSCGQEKVSPDTNFCSRCGFLLSGTAELLHTGGVIPQASSPKGMSPRARGIRQGIFIFLLMFPIAPIVGFISMALDIEPIGVGIAAVILFFGGILRMVYALMFEESWPRTQRSDDFLMAAQNHLKRPSGFGSLPPQQSYPAEQFPIPASGKRLDTLDLQPRSVTEGTTKLLEKDEER
jgi:hypothetical protein